MNHCYIYLFFVYYTYSVDVEMLSLKCFVLYALIVVDFVQLKFLKGLIS